MKNSLEGVFLRLSYAVKEAQLFGNTTIILGAGCSLSSTKRDISTWGIMKQCLLEHGIDEDLNNIGWEELYQMFINIVWQGKAAKEQEHLLRNKLSGLTPTEGHLCLRTLVEHGYIHNIITTNFDMLLEDTFKGLSYRKRIGDGQYRIIGDKPKFNLLKVHGDLDGGQFRFAPHELMRLPKSLQDDIAAKTTGPLIFIGYRGQDVGLMNCLSLKDDYAAYWINISQFHNIDMYANRNIYNFMEERSSAGNFLYGKEFGDFNGLLKKLNDFLIHPSYNAIIKTKEFNLSDIWKNTSILGMLRIYSRVYELFLDILEISDEIQKRLTWNSNNPAFSKNYDEHLYSFLYFFDGERLPSKLLHIPNNELDALILGVSIEILVRTTGNDILPKKFIEDIKAEFAYKYKHDIINDTFWFAVEKIVCSEYDIENIVPFNMPNKLVLKTYDAPLKEFNELLHIISFLALLLPTTEVDNNRIDSKYKIRQFLSGKYENISFTQNMINIDLGKINKEDADILYQYYLKTIPDIHILADTNVINRKKYMAFKSKWLNVNLEVVDQEEEEVECDNYISLWKKIKNQSEFSTGYFLKLRPLINNSTKKHIKLQFDKDISQFLASNKTGMFAIGASGCGKTSALQFFIHQLDDNIIPIIISPKNTETSKFGLSLFLGFDISFENEKMILNYLNDTLKQRGQKLLLILDGINEFSNIYQVQYKHYCCLIELVNKIYSFEIDSIKLIVTCREQAYYDYKLTTGIDLNPLCFYPSRKDTKNEAVYKIPYLSKEETQNLFEEYMSIQTQQQIVNINHLLKYNNLITDIGNNITPLFIALASESLNTFNGIEILKHSGTIYDLFSNTMMSRLEQVDAFFAQKVIFLYFDLILDYRNTNLQITKFKLLNKLDREYHTCFEQLIGKLIDVNILLKDYSKLNKIKFQHDKIEEFFFKLYLEEYEYKDVPFFYSIMELSGTNIIYQNGLTQYLIGLLINGRLKELKEIIIDLSVTHMDKISKIFIDVISNAENLEYCLKYVVSLNDIEASKKILTIIIWGLDKNLQDYSIAQNNISQIVDCLFDFPDNMLMTEEVRAYLLFYKSRIDYFSNQYIKALENCEKAQKFLKQHKGTLSVKINILCAVISIEQGKSAQAISYLEKDYEEYKKTNELKVILELGIELGRALNHCGQTSNTLEIYDFLLEHESEIKDPYILARIYEQKANSLNKIMYHKLQYGFIESSSLAINTLTEIENLFQEALSLYEKSIKLLLETNAIFTYSGVVPEKINMLISYSFAFKPTSLDECESMINEMDDLFINISTPFYTDYNISKAYYYEYFNLTDKAQACIEIALNTSLKLHTKNKEAKCRCFYAQFAYRQLQKSNKYENKWYNLGLKHIEKAIAYYKENTLIDNNINLEDCYQLKQYFLNTV